MKVIINADDAGLHPAVNRAIQILAEKGVVTSASVVATGEAVEEATQLQGVSLGVHLDVLRGRPVSHWQHVKTLCDRNGMFLCDPAELFELYAVGKVDHMQMEKEWSAQIEKILDYGIKPTHLTSHRHVHAWPSLTRMASDLADKYNIDWIRKPEDCSEISLLDKSGYKSKFRNICTMFDRESELVNWTDVFWQAEPNVQLSIDAFLDVIDECGDKYEGGVVEMGCTPGVTIAGDPIIPPHCNPLEISANWRTDFRSLAEDAWLQTFEQRQMTLTDFGRLSA